MNKEQKDVADFMEKASQDIRLYPTELSLDEYICRLKLDIEELIELAEGFGIKVKVGYATLSKEGLKNGQIQFEKVSEPNLIEIADALADKEYINIGTANACGIQLKPCFSEVHKTNMKKFSGDAHRNSDGKWVKPTGWKAPNFYKVLRKMFYVGNNKKPLRKELAEFEKKYGSKK